MTMPDNRVGKVFAAHDITKDALYWEAVSRLARLIIRQPGASKSAMADANILAQRTHNAKWA